MCTVKRLLNLIAGVAALSLLLAACGPSPQQKMESLKKDTDALAASLNSDFVALRELGVKYANLIGKMVDSGERQPDAPDGEYVWFEKAFYYTDPKLKRDHTIYLHNGAYLPEGSGGPIPTNYEKGKMLSPDGPEMARIKAHIAVLEAVWPQIKADYNARFKPGIWYVYACFPADWLAIFSFPIDIASVISPDLTVKIVSQAFWIQGVLPETNPDARPYWKPYVWVGAAGEGLLMGVSTPYRAQRDVDYVGVDSTFFLGSYMKDKLSAAKGNVVVLDAMTTVIGSAGTKLFKELPEFDYVQQLRVNPAYGEEFRLRHKNQSAEVQSLGQAVLAGKTQFEQSINGKTYLVVVSPIPEVKFYVVGLVEK